MFQQYDINYMNLVNFYKSIDHFKSGRSSVTEMLKIGQPT